MTPPSAARRPRLALAAGAVALVGFGAGLGLAAVTGGDDGSDEVVAGPAVERPTDTGPVAPPADAPTSTTSTTAAPVPDTSATSTSPPTTTPTTTAAPVPTTTATTAATSPSTDPPPAEPLPVATSVPSAPPGTPAHLSVSYVGQAGGVLRLALGEDSAVVVANAGGTQVRWAATVTGGVAIGGQTSVEVVLVPGQSALLPIRTLARGPAAVTVTSPTQSLVVPVEVR